MLLSGSPIKIRLSKEKEKVTATRLPDVLPIAFMETCPWSLILLRELGQTARLVVSCKPLVQAQPLPPDTERGLSWKSADSNQNM